MTSLIVSLVVALVFGVAAGHDRASGHPTRPSAVAFAACGLAGVAMAWQGELAVGVATAFFILTFALVVRWTRWRDRQEREGR